jgi:AcrR family transcriptional regulator
MNTRKLILDATRQLIATRGLARVTTREIARATGCAEGTLFKHFKNKEALVLAVVLENFPAFAESTTAEHVGQGSVRANLERIALASISFAEKLIPVAVTMLADAELFAMHRQTPHEGDQGPQRAFNLVADYIAGEQRLGRINPNLKPISVAALILGPCFQWAFFRHALGKQILSMSDQEFVGTLVETLLEGLSPIAKRRGRSPKHKT